VKFSTAKLTNKLIGAATFLEDSRETSIMFQTKGITEIKT